MDAGVCRPCRKQASLIAGPGQQDRAGPVGRRRHRPPAAVSLRPAGPRRAAGRSDALPAAAPPPRLVRLRSRWVQLLLFDPPRDLSRVSAQLPPVDAGLAERLHAEAGRLAGLRGWSPRTLSLTQRGLRILMAVHGPGEPVRASTVRQLTARNMPFPHITDVLAAAGVLDDDRPDTLAVWLDEQLAGLPAQIRAELDTWLGLLRHGGPRRRPRSRRTIVRDISSIRTFLTGVGGRYSTLRQVTRDDITDLAGRAARPVPAPGRQHAAQPVRHLEGRAADLRQPRPRHPRQQAQPVGARSAATRTCSPRPPPRRRTIPRCGSWSRWPAFTRCCPARSGTCAWTRSTWPAGGSTPAAWTGPLDEFTASAIRGYLGFRNQRWPATTSPYLLVTRKTAHTGEPVSQFWMNQAVPRPARHRRTAPRRPDRRRSPRRPGRPAAPGRRLRLRPPHRAALRPGRPSRGRTRGHAHLRRRHRIREFLRSGPSELLNSRETGFDSFFCTPGKDRRAREGRGGRRDRPVPPPPPGPRPRRRVAGRAEPADRRG